MRAVRLSRWWLALALVAFSAFAVPDAAQPQATPLTITLFLKNPPPDGVFPTTGPIVIVLQVQNLSGGDIFSTEGTSRTDFPTLLTFVDPQGNPITSPSAYEAHRDIQPFQCLSRGGVLVEPTAIQVVPVDVLSSTFAQQFEFDARRLYNLTRPGLYRGIILFTLLTFQGINPNAVITNCDQFTGAVVNVGPGLNTGTPFRIQSNPIEFVITQFKFGGFKTPLINDTDPACTALPCRVFKFGSTIPVKFQLFDGNNAVVENATPQIAVQWTSTETAPQIPEDLGTGATDTGNIFRFDPLDKQYIFNLDTKGLKPGTWRIDVRLDDHTFRSVHFGLR